MVEPTDVGKCDDLPPLGRPTMRATGASRSSDMCGRSSLPVGDMLADRAEPQITPTQEPDQGRTLAFRSRGGRR